MTSLKLFGTDGMRGPVSSPMFSPEALCRFGEVLALLAKTGPHPKKSITIGRDTRASGPYIEAALVSGILSAGVDCHLVGVLPSSAIAYCTKNAQSAFGVVISASHNPAGDNGIKLFSSEAFKVDAAIEELIEKKLSAFSPHNESRTNPGRIFYDDAAENNYLSLLKSVIDNTIALKNMRIVIDCAHGAASKIAPLLFAEVAELRVIGASPDGDNINRGFGSEYPGKLKNEVINAKADLGIGFDGDADRVIFVDEKGELIDGDALLAIFALHLKNRGQLNKNTLVSTVMSSIALDRALNPHGIVVERTAVGDKFVARHLLEHGYSFGGENSGHLIMMPETCTGDGLFFALQFLNILGASALPASQIASFYQPTPKILKNIPVTKKVPLEDMPLTNAVIEEAKLSLKNMGRIMLRYSGTENKLRILVEAPSDATCQQIADVIALSFYQELENKH